MSKLDEKLKKWQRKAHNIYSNEKPLTHKMNDTLPLLAHYRSTPSLERSKIYKGLAFDIEKVLFGVEYGFYNENQIPKQKDFYRAVFWNLTGKAPYNSLVELLKKHPILNRADIICFAHSDIGMARSENRNLIRSLALEKSYNYITMCSFLNLNTCPQQSQRKNLFGIEGLSVMTKFPMANFRMIPLRNTYDPMKGACRRIGCEKAMMVDLKLHEQKLTFIGAVLDEFSSPVQRAKQLKSIFNEIQEPEKEKPILFAGDLQTTTYNRRTNFNFALDVFMKVIRGYSLIAKQHHTEPQLFFEKKVFDVFKEYDFHYEDLNPLHQASIQKTLEDLVREKGVSTKLTKSFIRFLRRLFFSSHEQLTLKPDWFAANQKIKPAQVYHAEKPRLIENYSLNDSHVMTHTPMVLDFEMTS